MKRAILAFVTCILFPLSAATPIQDKVRTIELSANNTVVLSGYMDLISIDNIASALLAKRLMNEDDAMIYLVINSGGGEVRSAYRLEQFLSMIPNVQVICSYCASAAGYVFATYKNHNRMVTTNSLIMMHEMRLSNATAKDLSNPALIKDFLADSEYFNSKIRSVMGMSKDEYEKRIDGKDWQVRGQEIIKLKLANELIKIKCDDYLKSLDTFTCR